MIKRGAYNTKVCWVIDELKLGKFTPSYTTDFGAAFHRNAIDVLRELPSSSIDLVITSPPFALTRQKEYGNEPVDRYLEWFMPFCLEIRRVLKDRGSFVLDIGGAWVPGVPVRSVYHFDLAVRLANSKQFFLAQEFYWFNPARLPTPAEWVTVQRVRVKDAVNMVWWFSKTENPKAHNKNVLQPYSDAMKSLMKNGYKPKKRPSGHDISKHFAKDNGGAIPPNLLNIAEVPEECDAISNVLEIANTDSNSHYLRKCKEFSIRPHPARFPPALVRFFLDFLTDPGDIVLDPFSGSNVTGAACEASGRRWLSTELESDYIRASEFRFDGADRSGDAASPIEMQRR